MFTMNNKKQPPEVFYKKAVLKNFSMLTGKYMCSSLFLIKLQPFRSATFSKRDSNAGVFLVNIAKFLIKLILKKICERLLLNDVKRNYLSMKIVKQVLNVFQHLQENIFSGVSFLKNIVIACNLSLSLFKKRFR